MPARKRAQAPKTKAIVDAEATPDPDLGPPTSLVFFTALTGLPARLTIDADAPGVYGDLIFTAAPPDAEPIRIRPTSGGRAWPLRTLHLRTGVFYDWRIEPAGADGPALAAFVGRLWLLEESRLADLAHAYSALRAAEDADFAAIGRALLMTKQHLFQQALALVNSGPGRADRPSRRMLAHIAKAMIYEDMANALEAGEEPAAGAPRALLQWARAREASHRREASLDPRDAAGPRQQADVTQPPDRLPYNPVSSYSGERLGKTR